MFNLGAKYPIGIDIGSRHIHAAQIRQTHKGVSIEELAVRDLEANPEETLDGDGVLVSAIRAMSKNGRFRGKRALLHIPDKNISVFPIRFQVGGTESLEDAILRESQRHLSFPVEEAVIDYPSLSHPSSERDNTFKATIIAARREHIDHYLNLIKQAGLVVEAVDFPISSLIRLHGHIHNDIDEPVILCNIGYEQTLFTVVTRDSILAQRNIPWGVQSLFKKITTNLELSTGTENLKFLVRNHGLAYEDGTKAQENPDTEPDISSSNMSKAIYQIITPYVEELVYEFHTTISYVRAEEHSPVFEGIYLYGYATLINRMGRFLEKRLGLPIHVVNPLEHLELNGDIVLPHISDGAPFSLAIGLAMRKKT